MKLQIARTSTLWPLKAITTAALLLPALPNVRGQETPPPEPPKKWESVATLGATLTRGNSSTFLGSGLFNTKRKWTSDEVLFGGSAGYGENTTTVNGNEVKTVTDSYIKGYGQYNHLFSPRLYGGLRVTAEHDDIASLRYRTTISPLAGYYFIKQTNAFLAAEVGPSYVREKFFHETTHNYLAMRVGERGEYKFLGGSKIWESVEWLPKVQEVDNYLLTTEAGVSAPLTKALSISIIAQDTYKSQPAAGKLKNDFKLIAGLSYTF